MVVVLQTLFAEVSSVRMCHWDKSDEIASSSGMCFIEVLLKFLNCAFFPHEESRPE